jgi:hypothetical protein
MNTQQYELDLIVLVGASSHPGLGTVGSDDLCVPALH